MNFLLLIPGIFELLEKIVGPLMSSTKGSIISGLLGSNGTIGGIMEAITGVLGNIEQEKIVEITAQVNTLLAQSQVNQIDAKANSIWHRPALVLEWGLVIIILYHLGLAEVSNSISFFHGYSLAPLDNLTAGLMFGLLGLYRGAKALETVNSNSD